MATYHTCMTSAVSQELELIVLQKNRICFQIIRFIEFELHVILIFFFLRSSISYDYHEVNVCQMLCLPSIKK